MEFFMYKEPATMAPYDVWRPCTITEELPGNKANILIRTPDGRDVPAYGVDKTTLDPIPF